MSSDWLMITVLRRTYTNLYFKLLDIIQCWKPLGSTEQRVDPGAVWLTAVRSCPGTTGRDGISLDILSHTVSLFPAVKLPCGAHHG